MTCWFRIGHLSSAVCSNSTARLEEPTFSTRCKFSKFLFFLIRTYRAQAWQGYGRLICRCWYCYVYLQYQCWDGWARRQDIGDREAFSPGYLLQGLSPKSWLVLRKYFPMWMFFDWMNDFAWPMLSTSSAYLEKVSFWAIGPVRSFHPTLELPVSDPCFLFIGCTRTMHLFQVKSIKSINQSWSSLSSLGWLARPTGGLHVRLTINE